MTFRLAVWLAPLFLALPLAAQPETPAETQKPKTKLEAFVAQDGVVMVMGFSKIAELRGQFGGVVVIEAKEFTNASSGKHEYGITVEVQEKSRLEREHTSYVDLDEVLSLVKGLEYIEKIDKSATGLQSFQADYRTRGDLKIGTFSTDRGTMVAVSSGAIGKTTAYFALSDLSKIADAIKRAKATLDALRPGSR